MLEGCCANLQECLHTSHRKIAGRLNSPTDGHNVVKGTVVIRRSSGQSGPGNAAIFQLHSLNEIDHQTGRGKLSEEACLGRRKKSQDGRTKNITYGVEFHVEPDFGIPGALVVKNRHKHEFYLNFLTVEMPGDRKIHFDCNSWIYPTSKTKTERLFFSNTSYLPKDTPEALRKLRNEELFSLRGDGRGERKKWERIYDYDYYNDLGNPDEGLNHARPVLGGSRSYPYPRRGRTGRPPSKQDHRTESRHSIIDLDTYVPPDERFSPQKLSEFISSSIQAIIHFVIPEVKSLFHGDPGNFKSFDEMTNDLFSDTRNHVVEGWMIEKLNSFLPSELVQEISRISKKKHLKFPIPQIIASKKWAWTEDEEFGREMLAGLNPTVIRSLKRFPPVGKGGRKSSIKAADIENNLEGLTLEDAMKQLRILILDHRDYLMPYLSRINKEGVCVYASITLLFITQNSSLKPLAIELSLPGNNEGDEEITRVFLPTKEGTKGALWRLAKAHVAVNDSGYHQLISHWLKTHAAVEPFVIATRRQLSAMHPVHRLLDPHFKDTMQINALARSILLNAGGILEKTMFPRKYSLELSSMIYKDWRFDQQGLPQDLLNRGMAIEDPQKPSGVRLLLEDYPYAKDGLEIWTAIKRWVTGFCQLFYNNDEAVIYDEELQAWWSEVRQVGHGDHRRSGEGWHILDTTSNLAEALTTIIWIASALHAAVNFGQFGYAGFPPNRPTHCRKFIPQEGTFEFADFLEDPDKFFFEMLPDRFTTTLGLALIEVLSRHTADEVYLGQRVSPAWTDNEQVLRLFKEFGEELQEVERRISYRNSQFTNRLGPARIPYELLYPDTSNTGGAGGVTGKGIPNSVSI